MPSPLTPLPREKGGIEAKTEIFWGAVRPKKFLFSVQFYPTCSACRTSCGYDL